MIKINKRYKHYKGNIYRVLGIGRHSETCEEMVIYKSCLNDEIWIRPAYMWEEPIDKQGTKRFTLLEEPENDYTRS